MRKMSITKKQKQKRPVRLSQKSLTPGIAVNWNKTSSGADLPLLAGQRPLSCYDLLTVDSQACVFGWLQGKEQMGVVVRRLQLSESTPSIFSLLSNNATEQILCSAEKEAEKISLFTWLMLVLCMYLTRCPRAAGTASPAALSPSVHLWEVMPA